MDASVLAQASQHHQTAFMNAMLVDRSLAHKRLITYWNALALQMGRLGAVYLHTQILMMLMDVNVQAQSS